MTKAFRVVCPKTKRSTGAASLYSCRRLFAEDAVCHATRFCCYAVRAVFGRVLNKLSFKSLSTSKRSLYRSDRNIVSFHRDDRLRELFFLAFSSARHPICGTLHLLAPLFVRSPAWLISLVLERRGRRSGPDALSPRPDEVDNGAPLASVASAWTGADTRLITPRASGHFYEERKQSWHARRVWPLAGSIGSAAPSAQHTTGKKRYSPIGACRRSIC